MAVHRFHDVQGVTVGQHLYELALQAQRVQAVRVDPDERDVRLDRCDGILYATPVPADVVLVHGAREQHIRVRIESSDQLRLWVVEVRLEARSLSVDGVSQDDRGP